MTSSVKSTNLFVDILLGIFVGVVVYSSTTGLKLSQYTPIPLLFFEVFVYTSIFVAAVILVTDFIIAKGRFAKSKNSFRIFAITSYVIAFLLILSR